MENVRDKFNPSLRDIARRDVKIRTKADFESLVFELMENSEKIGQKVAGVVLTYHPSVELVENLKFILAQVSGLYIVNNSINAATEELLQSFSQNPVVKMINFGDNIGVAAGFNAGMKSAFEEGFDFVVLFDQDSFPNPGMVDRLLQAYHQRRATAGIVGPQLRDSKLKHFFDPSQGVQVKDLLISSGSLISASLVKQIGYLNEGYFVDYVDHEFCLRAKRAGKVNYIENEAVLEHQFGEPMVRKILGRRITFSNYSPVRHYYMARNRMLLLRSYGWHGWFFQDLKHLVVRMAGVLLYEEKKFSKFAAFLRGTVDGLLFSFRPRQGL